MGSAYLSYIIQCLQYWKELGRNKGDLIWETVVENIADGMRFNAGNRYNEAVCRACAVIRSFLPNHDARRWKELQPDEAVAKEIFKSIQEAFEDAASPDYDVPGDISSDRISAVAKQLQSIYLKIKDSERIVYPGYEFPPGYAVYALWRSANNCKPTYIGEGIIQQRIFYHQRWWGQKPMYITFEMIAEDDFRLRLLAERYLIALYEPGANGK